MRHEAVKYHNDLNSVMRFNNWTSAELNFFFAIIAKARDKGTDLLEFSKDELKEFSNSTEKKNDRIDKTFKELRSHILGSYYTEIEETETGHKEKTYLLFDYFSIEWDDKEKEKGVVKLEVSLSKHYEYILNQLTANFTSFELEEFLGLKSVYSKQLYRYLKQWRTIGRKEFKIDEFKEILNIPESYEQRDINKRVMKPILKELSTAFKNLTVSPIKARKKGSPIIAYLFEWDAEQTGQWQDDKPYTFEHNEQKRDKESVPNWYSDTGGTPPSKELLEKALKLQRGEKD